MKEYHALAAPAFDGATGGSSLRQRLQPVILVIIPDLALQNLARRGVRQFVDEDDFVGQPPFRDLVLQIIEDVRLADIGAGFLDDQQNRDRKSTRLNSSH